ncbi:MAG TPA: DUF126 domain-containing protein [Actinomycetota bacterium]
MAEGRALAAGMAEGVLIVLREPLSFWGGMDPETGEVIDAHHPQRGEILTGRVVAMPSGRGSSSASSVLAEAIRIGKAPVALVLMEPDPIVALGSVVASELYGSACPVVVLDEAAYERLRTGDSVRITADERGARVEALA